jgi:hypothetical protein
MTPTADGEPQVPVISVDHIVRRIRKYRTRDLLEKVGHLSNRVDREGGGLWEVTRRQRSHLGQMREDKVYFTHWALAFIAKHSILEGSDLNTPLVTQEDLFELAGLYGLLDDPFLGRPHDEAFAAFGFLVRTSWEQFSLQESVRELIPRYYALFKLFTEMDKAPVLDIPGEWHANTGMSIEDYMILGVAAWAMALNTPRFWETVFARTEVESVRQRATKETLGSFFNLVSADYQRFRSESSTFQLGRAYAKTEFNVLRKYPLIRLGRRELVAPVPRLILERATKGVYYEMQGLYAQSGRNVFTEQFGKNFEAYVGFLLKRAYGEDQVRPEPVYGREHRRGPDWILIEGDTAFLFECTVTGTSLEAKSLGDFETIIRDMGRVYVERVARYPRKIRDLRDGKTGIDLGGVRRFVPLILTHEPVYIEPVIRAYIEAELQARGTGGHEYHLLDVSDLEVVTGWSGSSFSSVFGEWQKAYTAEPQSFRAFLRAKAFAQKLTWINPFLGAIVDEFFAEQLPVARDG